jgi:hypothetical protein
LSLKKTNSNLPETETSWATVIFSEWTLFHGVSLQVLTFPIPYLQDADSLELRS